MPNVYLDYAATSPPDPSVLESMMKTAVEFYANPSSPHADGRRAARILQEARDRTATALGALPDQIIFTSGGTESNAIALQSVLKKRGKGHVVIPGIEHPSVYETAIMLRSIGFEVTVLNASNDGTVSPLKVRDALRPDTVLVAIMAVNNETGAIQPVKEIVSVVGNFSGNGKRRIHVHCDAVQAFGKIPFSPRELGVDSASFSGHKFYGPRGIGILYVQKRFEVFSGGGGQEMGMRSGTENLPAIYGMSRAAEQAAARLREDRDRAIELRSRLIERIIRLPDCRIIPENLRDDPESCSPYILSASFPPIPGEVLVRVLSDAGYSVSTGSACSTGKKRRVLAAMDVSDPVSFSTIRISTGRITTIENIDGFCDVLERETSLLRKVAH